MLRGPVRADLLREETLPDLFAATVRHGAGRPALIWSGRTISYGELNAAGEAIASALVRRGAGPAKIVGLWLPRGADLLIAQLGIAQSGAA